MPQRAERNGQRRARTADTGLFRAVLYQLSYLTMILGLLSVSNPEISGRIQDSGFDRVRIVLYDAGGRQSVHR